MKQKRDFGTNVIYCDPYDYKAYHAVIIGKHDTPRNGDYDIIVQKKKGETKLMHCFADRLRFMEDSIIDLLEEERQRAMDIAYSAMSGHLSIHEIHQKTGNRMAFVEAELANECRIIGNAISGGSAASNSLGETMRDRIAASLLIKYKSNEVPG